MVFKQFRIQTIIRIALLLMTLILLAFLIVFRQNGALAIVCVFVLVYQVVNLFHYVQKTNKELSRFLESVKYSDFSQSFTSQVRDTGFDELYDAFNNVIAEFRRTRAEKEEHYRYLQTVVQHIGTGLLAFKSTGEIDLINNAAKRLLKQPYLQHINQLAKVSPEFVEKIVSLKAGEKTLIKLDIDNELVQLSVYATDFILRQQQYKLVSISNIQSELEEKEMEAWQNLIRVLTHEIMNSITPISSLASTSNRIVSQHLKKLRAQSDSDADSFQDVLSAVQTIEKRSNSLSLFVQNYRKLTKIPRPDFKIFQISELFERLNQLMRSQMDEAQIHFSCSIDPESLELTADPGLVEQVLLNLLKNAMEAVDGSTDAHIQLNAGLDNRSRACIEVVDNGCGIREDAMKNIFIPFFTTKKDGSGIGLSLSRQIMRQHGGTILLHSVPNQRTVFTLKF